MALRIEDYALIGDCHTGALVGIDGSIDWFCLPRFDSESIFAAILGDEDSGRWLVSPVDPDATAERSYIEDTFVLVTRWTTATGVAEVVDFMPLRDGRADVVRRVRGIRGTVRMRQDLRLRFDYAETIPWVRQVPDREVHALLAAAGPNAVVVRGPRLHAAGHAHVAEFDVAEGETVDTVLTWYPSHRKAPRPLPVDERLERTVRWWQDWIAGAKTGDGPYSALVRRSMLVLRALTHEETGGIVAAATTSLPEDFGGERNWDYRYVWLRDASLTLEVLLEHGYVEEAQNWRQWLLRAIAGDPSDVQIMYGLAGERRLVEWEVSSLPGYEGSTPVRIGNGAFTQYQGDVFGEVMIALQRAREAGLTETSFSWPLQRALLHYVSENWQRPDNGIWEVRGPQRHFTHSRVMLWAAFDCAIRGVREHGLDGPVEQWEGLRDTLRDEIEREGWDPELNSYTQYYGSGTTDASLLQLSAVGFVDADDPRMLGTVAAIEKELMRDGLLERYRTEEGVDGLAGGEHPFLTCSFWLAEQYARSGRLDDARALLDRLAGLATDLGLLSEEYAVAEGRQAGNTPQALSHLALVRAVDALEAARQGEHAPTRDTAPSDA
ncbi:glycoside hydrolase family 15 protein [Herbiconiux sp. SYSU D00978]|uniref:glycoside hydrolase family 15 protein n=1 Tax=Herbiconiux sp. SYSU D00978 TaxID=2812562 RepID=UPI001A964DD1|nr:glycoside hydrolase family 15 protein [Herbiconiux sp. SYSU D00978]